MILDYSENLIRVKYIVLGLDLGKKYNAKKKFGIRYMYCYTCICLMYM